MDWDAAESLLPETFWCATLRELHDPPPYDRDLMRSLGLPGVQFGSMNRLHRSCLNLDLCRVSDGVQTSAPGRIYELERRGYYLQKDATRPLPIADGAFDWAYSEHFVEHLGLRGAIAWLREVRRVVRTGGLVRITTPDLRRYAQAYLAGDTAFFAEHARQLAAMGLPGAPVRPAWMVNQLFRFYGHRWIFDADELRHLAAAAGFDPATLKEYRFGEGQDPAVCKLDQAVRSDESLYVELVV